MRPDQSAARPSDLAAALFTSGSTGTPKAALHTQRGLAYKARVMAAAHQLTPDDAILMPAPLAHISGLLNGVLLPGVLPMRVELMARWSPGEALATIASRAHLVHDRAAHVLRVAHGRARLRTRHRSRACGWCRAAGPASRPRSSSAASATLDARVKRTYGSTEAPTVTTSTPADSVERARETDGRPTGAVELRVSAADTGRALSPGEPGELLAARTRAVRRLPRRRADPGRRHPGLVPHRRPRHRRRRRVAHHRRPR